MRGVVVQIDGYDPVAGAPVSLRVASHDLPDICALDEKTWWPAIATLPKLRYDLFDGSFAGQIVAPATSMSLSTEPWPLFAQYGLADAKVSLWTGEIGQPWSAWTLRLQGRSTARPQIKDGRAELSLAVDDRWLDTALLAAYAGTTKAEGPAALKGLPKPLALGAPRYVPGTLIDSVNSVFQVSGYGPIQQIEAALEKAIRYGAPIADHPSYDALVAATIPRGTWATALAVGMARFGAPPEGKISFLLQGDQAGPDGWARLPGQIIRRLALLAGGAGRIDDASLDALDDARPYPQSIYLDEQTTARELIQRIAASVNAVAGVSWTGKLFVLPVELRAPTLTLAANGSALPPVGRIDQLEIDAPWRRLAIQSERTWALHDLSDVAFTATLIPMGDYQASTTYREGNIVQYQGSTWLYTNPLPTSGNAPPSLPTESDSFWQVLAKAGQDGTNGADGRDGRDGINGRDGAPGETGADGRTSYIHYAYANSPDGRVDFELNQPNGRAYEGSYTDFTAADSSDPAAYVWREYKGPPFGLATRGAAVAAGNNIIKNGGSPAWDSDGYSTSGYKNGCAMSFKADPSAAAAIMCGLNTDPTADASYGSLDYAWYPREDGNAEIYESGGSHGVSVLGYGEGLFGMDYDGRYIRYLYNQEVRRAVDIGPGFTFYLDSSLHTPNARIRDIQFGSYPTRASNGVTLVGDTPTTQIAGNSVRGTGNSGWGSEHVHSQEAYSGGASASWTLPPGANTNIMAGLGQGTGRDRGNSFDSITFSIFRQDNGNTDARINGNSHVTGPRVDVDQPMSCRVHYDGLQYVNFWINGIRFAQYEWGKQSDPLRFIAALASQNPRIDDIVLTPSGANGADGRNGLDGTNGTNGRDGTNGTNGVSSFVHLAYADSAEGSVNFTTGAVGGRAFVGIYRDQVEADSGDYRSYAWSRLRGIDGTNGRDGTPGQPGADGRTPYTHFAYANSPDGSSNFSTDDPAGRTYLGVYTDYTVADSTDYRAYSWSLIKGADGKDAAVYTASSCGNSAIRPTGYAHGLRKANGQPFVDSANAYLSTDRAVRSYTIAWQTRPAGHPEGEYWGVRFFDIYGNGEQSYPPGDRGSGIDGMAGLLDSLNDGTIVVVTTADEPNINHTHPTILSRMYNLGASKAVYGQEKVAWRICGAYALVGVKGWGEGRGFERYAGAIDNDPAAVVQMTFQIVNGIPSSAVPGLAGSNGLNGTNGTNGKDGTNGTSSFVHLAYADSADGSVNFTTGAVGGRAYVGIYRDQVEADSGDYRAYAWSRLRGIDGTNGKDGTPGQPGADGRTPYTHFAYATSADGSSNFSTDNPSGRTYLGVYTDYTVADSTDYRAYSWSLIKGADGAQGPAGISAPQPLALTDLDGTLPAVLVKPGQTITGQVRESFQNNSQSGTVTIQLQYRVGSGGWNYMDQRQANVGPGEPGGVFFSAGYTSQAADDVLVQIRVVSDAPGGTSLRTSSPNYLRAY